MVRHSSLVSNTRRREAQQRQYKKRVLDVCAKWRPGLIARSLRNKRKKE